MPDRPTPRPTVRTWRIVAFSGATHLVYGALLGVAGARLTGGAAPPRPEV